MGTNRVKAVLIVLLIVAVILLGAFWYLSNQSEQSNLNNNLNTNTGNNLKDNNVNDNVNNSGNTENNKPTAPRITVAISETEKLKSQLEKIATAFVERYGSYSNQSDYENLEDLMQFMTRNLKSKTESFIKSKRAGSRDNSIYYGVTTKVLNIQDEVFTPNANFIKFNASAQKQEMVGSSANTNVYYQNVDVELKKEGGIWKVNKITWL